MKLNISIMILTIGVLALCAGTAYAKHPAEGHPVMDYWWIKNSHFPPAALSIDDLTFMPEGEYPDWDALTQLELPAGVHVEIKL